MVRFYPAPQVAFASRSPEAIKTALAGCGDKFLQLADADAGHMILALGFDKAGVLREQLKSGGLVRRAERLIRAIDQGHGKDFTRSPRTPLDDGLNEFEVKGYAAQLKEVAAEAVARGLSVCLLVYDPELLGS